MKKLNLMFAAQKLTKEQMRQLKGGNRIVDSGGGSIICHMQDDSSCGDTVTDDPCDYSMGYDNCVDWINMGCDNNTCCEDAWCDWYY